MAQSIIVEADRLLEKYIALGGFFCDFGMSVFSAGLWLSGYIA